MTKEEILKVWTESNIITNFNVGITEDEVLNRPAVIETQNAYYYRGKKITLDTAPANCVVLKANQRYLPIYLLVPNTKDTLKLNVGYISTLNGPVKASTYRTALRDWVHFILPLCSIINLNKNNMRDKIKVFDSSGYKDLRYSVFGNSYPYYENYDFKTATTTYVKHLNYQEMYLESFLIHPTTRLLLENYNNNYELDGNIVAASRVSPYFTKTISTALLEVGFTKGVYKFLLKRGSKGKKQNKTSESVIDILDELPNTIFHEYKGSLLIQDRTYSECWLWEKHSRILYRYNKNVEKWFCAGKKPQMNLGNILDNIYDKIQDTDVMKYCDEFIQALPLIYKIGNYKYTLGYFMDKTGWKDLPISPIIKLYIMVYLLKNHPNDHLIEILFKEQINKCPDAEILCQQFDIIVDTGIQWYINKRHYDYNVRAYIQNTNPSTVHELWNWFCTVWYQLQTAPKYSELIHDYPIMKEYHIQSLREIAKGYNSFTPTWQYKNLQAQLHMSFSMLKGFLKENPFKEGSMALRNWNDITDYCMRCLVRDDHGNRTTSLPQKIKIISSITYEQYQTLASVYDSSRAWEWSSQVRYLHEAVYGKNNIITMASLCKAITIFHQKFPNATLSRVEELMRQVSSPNEILRRTECPTLLSQCNYNYIANWMRREDVCHLVEMIKRANPTSGDYWQNKFELLRNNKISLESYLLVLHNFYAEVDQYLHQEAVLLAEAELNKKLINVSSELEKYKYSDDKLLIRPAKDIKELQNEGQTLHHCVFGFRSKMAEKRTFIFFIRNKACVDVPYYTVELKNDSPKWIRQVHGKGNSQPTPEIVSFLKKWAAKFKFNQEVKDTYNALG